MDTPPKIPKGGKKKVSFARAKQAIFNKRRDSPRDDDNRGISKKRKKNYHAGGSLRRRSDYRGPSPNYRPDYRSPTFSHKSDVYNSEVYRHGGEKPFHKRARPHENASQLSDTPTILVSQQPLLIMASPPHVGVDDVYNSGIYSYGECGHFNDKVMPRVNTSLPSSSPTVMVSQQGLQPTSLPPKVGMDKVMPQVNTSPFSSPRTVMVSHQGSQTASLHPLFGKDEAELEVLAYKALLHKMFKSCLKHKCFSA